MDMQEDPKAKKQTMLPTYIPAQPFYRAGVVGLQSAGVGLLVSAVQNTLNRHSAGAAGVFTRTGGTITFFAAMGGIFAFTDAMSANIREKNDAVNGFAGGCSAGALAGLRARSLPTAVMACGVIGGLVATFDVTGRSLTNSGPVEDRETRRLRFFKKPPPFLELPPSSKPEPDTGS